MLLLLAKFLRWCATVFGWFVLIVAVLALGHFLSSEYREIASQISSVNDFRSARTQLDQFIEDQETAVSRESRELRNAAENRLQSRLNEIDREIAQRKEETKSPLRSVLASGADAPRALMEARVRLAFLEQQRPYVARLLEVAIATRGLAAARNRRAQLQSQHVKDYRELQDAKRRLASFEAAYPLLAHIPFTTENIRLGELEGSRDDLFRQNQAAARAVKDQDAVIKRLQQLPQQVPSFRLDRGPIQPVLNALDAEIANREQLRVSNWAAKLITPIQAVIPTAAIILASLILAPLLVKSFLFFVVAPVAARRPPVRLLMPAPDAAATLHAAAYAYATPVTISAVSKTLVVDELHELIVHPEFLQSFSISGDKKTKWLLDWKFPISSLAAGLYALTRVRTESTESVVISDATDPLGEIGVLALPEGVALVFQPHNLVGVMQLRERPIRITRHWRLGSLTAWLTLQLRYLIFHGPATLIVKGCRGVRVEPAGRGRSLDQSATIGFSANLEYSVSRCETFLPYLMGKQGLFNDSFAGGPGYYVYEETPHFRKRSGVTGRSLEGMTDAVLKLFGI